MPDKRPANTALIPNPFVKRRNLGWTLTTSDSSPLSSKEAPRQEPLKPLPTTAAIESGSAQVDDHLAHFSTHLAAHISPSSPSPLLSIPSFASLYTANSGDTGGAHFVIHQHDHPIAGTHYDLRLQINENSSVSWAIMYGLPGDPNSARLNRNATETRIHCLWNHLVETASSATGSLLIWDTGTYSILPRRSKHAPTLDPSSPTSSPPSSSLQAAAGLSTSTPQALLHDAFQNRKIRLRLHGSRLPDPFVLNLRLTKSEDAAGRAPRNPQIKKRRRRHAPGDNISQPQLETTDGDDRSDDDTDKEGDVPVNAPGTATPKSLSAMEREIQELEDEQVRKTNAYPGAKNTIGSIHQRRWYLSLDRPACDFAKKQIKGRSVWVHNQTKSDDERTTSKSGLNDGDSGGRLSFPFYVRGVDHERSVVTGRRATDVLNDEGVENFSSRKGWMPVLN